MTMELTELNERVRNEAKLAERLLSEVGHTVVGQQDMLEGILIGLLTNGHILLEGVPGLAKTLTIATMARAISLHFQRIQFTPDLLPSDLIGTMIFNQKTFEFVPKKGPVFASIVLADEINRAPAKVQSALLEAMAERQVTIGEETYKLPSPFLVLATQNPLEQEGTYPLPEAQMDRFMFKIIVRYPTKKDEMEILNRMSKDKIPEVKPVISPEDLARAKAVVDQIYVDEKVKGYIIELVMATRHPADHGLKKMAPLIRVGASPRATISLVRAAKAHAFLRGRGFVTVDDVKAIAYPVLRHRLILTYEAEAEDMNTDAVVKEILGHVEVP